MSTSETIHEKVRARYAAAAVQADAGGCCSGERESIGPALLARAAGSTCSCPRSGWGLPGAPSAST
jgi:hypothetical protein